MLYACSEHAGLCVIHGGPGMYANDYMVTYSPIFHVLQVDQPNMSRSKHTSVPGLFSWIFNSVSRNPSNCSWKCPTKYCSDQPSSPIVDGCVYAPAWPPILSTTLLYKTPSNFLTPIFTYIYCLRHRVLALSVWLLRYRNADTKKKKKSRDRQWGCFQMGQTSAEAPKLFGLSKNCDQEFKMILERYFVYPKGS